MSEDAVQQILKRQRTVAVVGVSRDPSKDSYKVAEYLKTHGFNIVPVNPFIDEVLGQRAYKSLLEIPEDVQKRVEVVDIFRPSAEVPRIVERAIQLKKKYDKLQAVWMQLGIVDRQAAETAKDAGLIVVMNKCMMQQHKRLFEASV